MKWKTTKKILMLAKKTGESQGQGSFKEGGKTHTVSSCVGTQIILENPAGSNDISPAYKMW